MGPKRPSGALDPPFPLQPDLLAVLYIGVPLNVLFPEGFIAKMMKN